MSNLGEAQVKWERRTKQCSRVEKTKKQSPGNKQGCN